MLHSAENPKGRGWASGSQNFFAKLKTSFLPRRSLGRTEKKSNKSPTVPLQKKNISPARDSNSWNSIYARTSDVANQIARRAYTSRVFKKSCSSV